MSQRLTRKQAAERRRRVRIRRRRRLTLVFLCAALLLFLSVNAVRIVGRTLFHADSQISVQSAAQEPDETAGQPASVSLVAVGDNLIHNTLIADAANGDGTYDFTSFYADIKPYIQAADIAFVNQESPLGTGEPSGYPNFNTPQACGDALIDAGFDVICHANNHAMDAGSSAVYDTLDFWDSHAKDGVIRVGIARSARDRAKVRYIERNGIKIGFLAYTYGLNGHSLPQDNPDLVSLIDRETIAKEMAAVRKKCDAVVVAMHWGEEYADTENAEQDDLAEFLTENGASVIIGSHPHVCQPCKWVKSSNGNRAFCLYSTGNFISAQDKAATMVEGMLQVTLTRRADGSIVVENAGVMPLVCWFNSHWRGYTVMPLQDYTETYASTHALAGRVDMRVSNLRSIAEDAFGVFMLDPTIPPTYDTAYANAHGVSRQARSTAS